MSRKFRFTEEEQAWFDDFIKTDEFAEALAIAWRYGARRRENFSIRSKRRWIVARFKELLIRTGGIRHCDFDEDYIYWEVIINFNHPFFLKMEEMGWSQITQGNRLFPVGNFNEIAFVKTYILLLHDVGTMREKKKDGYYVRGRLRIHGSVDVLNNVCRVLHQQLGVGMKKLQTDHKIEKAKTIYFQSKTEIPAILEFVGAFDTLEKYHSFPLGYHEEQKEKESV